MKRKIFRGIPGIHLLTVITVAVILSAGSLFAATEAKGNTVVADGIAKIVDDNIAVAEREALRDAQRVAIEKVVGVMIYSTSLVKNYELVNDCIGSSTAGYIDSYEIISRGRDGSYNNYYKMRVSATVSRSKLYNNYRTWLQSLGNPKFIFESHGNSELEEIFTEFLIDLGFTITTDLGKAAYVIQLNGKFISYVHPLEQIEGTQLNLWVKMVDVINREVVFNLKNNPKKSTSFRGNKAQQHDITAKKAFIQLKKPLQKEIQKSLENWSRHQCN